MSTTLFVDQFMNEKRKKTLVCLQAKVRFAVDHFKMLQTDLEYFYLERQFNLWV